MELLMVTLRSRFESLRGKDMPAIGDLYTPALSAKTMANAVEGMSNASHTPVKLEDSLSVLNKASGDEAAGSPAAVLDVHVKRGTLSSPEEDSSIDKTPCGTGIMPKDLPALKLLPSY